MNVPNDVAPSLPILQPGMQPVTTAPAAGAMSIVPPDSGWPPPNTICPPGLEYLISLDRLFVNQKMELFEVLTGWERKNKYSVMNAQGMPVFQVAEDSGFCARLCLGSYRSCEFHVVDVTGREVLRMSRPCGCNSCCCPCCMQEIEVYSGETLLGSVVQKWSIWRPAFDIRDASGETVLTIKGPCIRCGNVKFDVLSTDGQHRVGNISKVWGGLTTEFFTDADMFGITFPLDLDVKFKAVLLGASLLIDFMYFEKQKNLKL